MKTSTNEVDERLNALHRQAIEVLNSLGYKVPETVIRLNGRLTSTYGRCYTKTLEIELNKKYFLYSKDDVVINTILHELIHAMCPQFDHNGDWKTIADKVSSETIYDIQEKGNDEDEEYLKFCGKFKLVCNKCGKTEYYINKKESDVKIALHHNLYHIPCGEETEYEVCERINNEWIKIN